MKYIFRWQGTYLGFIDDGWFFDSQGCYLGWVDTTDRVWNADGTALGQLVDERYILRNTARSLPIPQTSRVPPVAATPPLPPGNCIPRAPRPGWIDALDDIGRIPNAAELVGDWREQNRHIQFQTNGHWLCQSPGQPDTDTEGHWEIRDHCLVIQLGGAGENLPEPMIYQILEFKGDRLKLRWRTSTTPSLPFVLQRITH